MIVSLIVACDEQLVIGRGAELPWRLSADLKRFKSLTMGHTLVMGRKTYESIGRPLPGRVSIVLTRQRDWSAPGVSVVHSLDDALRLASADSEVFVIGGADVFRAAWERADRLYLTRVLATTTGDVRLDPWDESAWRLVSREAIPADEKNEYPSAFERYERIASFATRQGFAMNAADQEIWNLNQRLLNSIVQGDWAAYEQLCHSSLTCFEAETRGQLVEGLPFHKYYFELGGGTPAKRQVTMAAPHLRWLGADAAVLSYVRLTQYLDANGAAQTARVEETRVWQKIDGRWQHVHFHRSTSN